MHPSSATLCLALRRAGIEARGAAGVAGALDALRTGAFDAVLAELDLPGPGGVGLLRAMEGAGLRFPFVGMGSDPRPDQLIALLRHGGDDFLSHPVEASDLQAALRRIAGRAKAAAPIVASDAQGAPLASSSPAGSGHGDLAIELLRRLRRGELVLPPLDPIARRLQALLERPDGGVDGVVRAVSHDPDIVAGVLRLGNSGPYRVEKGGSDLRLACLRLGNRRVLALGQQVIIGGLHTLDREPYGAVVADLWRNTLVCARGARLLAGALDMPDPEGVFVAALLHNIGELALLRVLSEQHPPSAGEPDDLREVARVLRGAHEEVGAAVLRSWGMPERLARIAGHHHAAAPGDGDEERQRIVCRLAWSMALREGCVYLPGQIPPPLEPLMAALGLRRDEVEDAFRDCRKWVNAHGTLDGTAA